MRSRTILRHKLPRTLLALPLALLFAAAGRADVPFVFQPGDTILASEINANFAYLESIAAGQDGLNLVRVQVDFSVQKTQTVFTVPLTESSPWVLRSIVHSCLGSLAFGPILDLENAGSILNLEIPFAPGESFDVNCLGPGRSGYAWFVYSK